MTDSDAKQHAPALDAKGEVARAMEMAADLCLIEDPPEEPFRSKYKARDLLIKAKQSHAREAKGGESTPSMALVDYRLGVIALAVEENSAAQQALDKCAVAFFEGVVGKIATAAGKEDEDGNDGRTKGGAKGKSSPPPVPTETPPGMVAPSPLAREHPAEAADTLTQLGLLWSSRGYPRRSLFYLLASVGFLKEASSSAGGYGAAEEGGEGAKKTEELGKEAGTKGGGHVAGVPGTKVGGAEGRKKLESLLTHTLYYLAQAYGAQDAEQSAKYCALTLQRQLDASHRGEGEEVSFDPGEWSRNACFLSTYYGGQGRPRAAGRCLLAAQSVLATPKGGQTKSTVGKTDDSNSAAAAPMPPPPPSPSAVPSVAGTASGGKPSPKGEDEAEPETEAKDQEVEERRERRADVNRHLANLYISVLEARHRESTASRGGFDPTGAVPPPGPAPVPPGKRPEGEGVEERKEREEEEKLGFVSLGLGDLPLCDPSQIGGDFDAVREVFKLAKRYTDRALQYYVLDGHVTAHVVLQQGLSRAYRCLITYEPNLKRREAMFARRAQALDPLLKALAVKAYLRLHKELSFELGEIYQEMARVKLGRMDDTENVVKNKKASLRAISTMYETALGFFAHFIKLYHEEDKTGGAPDSPAQPDKSMGSEEVQDYLMARFMRARLNARLTPSCMKKKLAYTLLSLAEFTWIENNADKHLTVVREENPGIFREEMEMVKDYVRMQQGNKERLIEAIEEEAAYF